MVDNQLLPGVFFMKKAFFSFLCISTLTFAPLHSHQPKIQTIQAAEWMENFLSKKPLDEELLLTLNLLYWSYARSAATSAAQQAYLEHVEHTLEVVQNINSRRRNPSIPIKYPYAFAQAEQTYPQFITETKHYHETATTYAETVEYILNFYPLSPAIKTAIENLREQARTELAHAVTAEASDFLLSFDLLQKLINRPKKTKLSFSAPAEVLKKSIVGFVAQWVPLAAVGAFVKFDIEFNTITEQWWKTLMNAYELNNRMWHVFETARANFYLTHYRLLHNRLKADSTDARLFLQAFDKHGFITPENRIDQLPEL